MYQAHWGLQQSPFRSRLDPQFFYQSPTHEEALARLHFLVEQRYRLGLLMGPAGSGKSLLLQVFADGLRRTGRLAARVDLLGVEPAEMLALLAAEFKLNVALSAPVGGLWRALTDRLTEYRYQQVDAVIFFDDADQAGEQVLDQVARIARYDRSPEARLTIVLAGRRERMGRLGETLIELAELRIDVEPWDQSDTEEYLKTSLAQAGRQSPVFANGAVARLYELSRGIPRRVSQLADLSLLAGAGAELEQIDADVVESVYHELAVLEV